MPAEPRALPGLSPLPPDAPPDARVPSPRSPGQPPSPTVRPVQVRYRKPRGRGVQGSPRDPVDEGPGPPLRHRRRPRWRSDAGIGGRARPADRPRPLGGEAPSRPSRSGADVWVADVSRERLGWAVRQGVAPARAVSDYRAALAQVDAVDIVTPADSH